MLSLLGTKLTSLQITLFTILKIALVVVLG
jgi:hypothetical protein